MGTIQLRRDVNEYVLIRKNWQQCLLRDRNNKDRGTSTCIYSF